MKNFVVVTDTPGRLASFLESRGIIEKNAQGNYEGVIPGMEWIEVPNRIITDNSDPDNPVYDTRSIFMVKFARESEQQKAGGFRDWVMANSTAVTAPANYTLGGEPLGEARKVDGQNVWLINDRPERFGGWQ